MANPKGNINNLIPIRTDREEPLIHRVTVKVPKSMNDQLNALENKAEFIRNAIQKALDEIKK